MLGKFEALFDELDGPCLSERSSPGKGGSVMGSADLLLTDASEHPVQSALAGSSHWNPALVACVEGVTHMRSQLDAASDADGSWTDVGRLLSGPQSGLSTPGGEHRRLSTAGGARSEASTATTTPLTSVSHRTTNSLRTRRSPSKSISSPLAAPGSPTGQRAFQQHFCAACRPPPVDAAILVTFQV
jgi:hypothetical protein